MKIVLIFLTLVFLLLNMVTAGEIYIWTDADGVKRFSDHPPTNDSKKVEVIEGVQESDSENQQPGIRENYRRMIETVVTESHQNEVEKQRKEEADAAERTKKEEADKQSRADLERQRLQKQIDALNNRALSPGFTEGMRQNQIEAIQRAMDQIDSK